MHKIDHPTAAPGGLFTIGNPINATPATVVTDDWLNAVQQEVVNAIEGAGEELDKSDNTQLLTAIKKLIEESAIAWQTGDVKLSMKSAPAAGWIACNDGTIGKTGSAGTARANDDTAALYSLLWNTVADTFAPVSGGRGVSAANDFAAGKTISLTRMLGRALAIAGSGASLTSRSVGQYLGAEAHTLAESEIPSHTHANTLTDLGHAHTLQFRLGTSTGGNNHPMQGIADNSTYTGGQALAAQTGITINNAARGGGGAHNNMQPTAFLFAHIKL